MNMNEILTKKGKGANIFGLEKIASGQSGCEAAHWLEMEPVCPIVLVDGFNLSDLG